MTEPTPIESAQAAHRVQTRCHFFMTKVHKVINKAGAVAGEAMIVFVSMAVTQAINIGMPKDAFIAFCSESFDEIKVKHSDVHTPPAA